MLLGQRDRPPFASRTCRIARGRGRLEDNIVLRPVPSTLLLPFFFSFLLVSCSDSRQLSWSRLIDETRGTSRRRARLCGFLRLYEAITAPLIRVRASVSVGSPIFGYEERAILRVIAISIAVDDFILRRVPFCLCFPAGKPRDLTPRER